MATVELEKMYTVKDFQTIGPTNVLNIYTVQRSDPTAVALNIAQAFEDRVIAPMLPLQDVAVAHTKVEVQNLVNATDFNSIVPSPSIGTRVGEAPPGFQACSIQFNRLRTDMKNGQKRFLVGIESDWHGDFWLAGFLTSMETVRDPILAGWFRDATPAITECNFVVIKRICKTSPSPPCVGGYRFPVDDSELVFYNPTSGIVRNTVRSQVSRKRYT